MTAARADRPEPADAARDDAALVAAARANPDAFTLLYERYARQVYRYCYFRLGSREAAEDATSQVFLDALTDLPAFRGGAFAGWLLRIAQHTVADTQRRGRRDRFTVGLDAAPEMMDSDPMPEEAAIARSSLDELRATTRTLPSDQRLVIELQLAGLTTKEIAAATGRSMNAVRIARYRAFRHLRPLLSGDAPVVSQAEGGAA